ELLGTCEPAGLCSFPDAMCPSGKKYGELAGDQSGQCVGDGGGSTSSGTSSPTSTTSVSVTGSGTFDPTTDPGSGTTFDPTTGLTGASDTTLTTDPSTTSITTDPVTSDPGTTTGPTCGQVGEGCIDGTCCGACAVCQDNVCQAGGLDVAASVCGSVCSACTAEGQCGSQPGGTTCKSNCSDIVWQQVGEVTKTTCYAYADLAVDSVCDAGGHCIPPALENCPDPSMVPGSEVPLASCDNACLQGADLCTQGQPASTITPGSYCALNVETAGCKSACTDGNLSVVPASCNSEGVCAYADMSSCAPYLCNPDNNSCFAKCSDSTQCATGKCQGSKCM
ncbi:MAG TPA: hypothetical protein VGB85_11845, partial [Nannocystis sp.]